MCVVRLNLFYNQGVFQRKKNMNLKYTCILSICIFIGTILFLKCAKSVLCFENNNCK